MVGAKAAPPPHISDCNREEDICSEGDSEGEDNSYLPPEVFALTWHADVGYIMHMVSRIAYFIHQICHLLSLDILCANYIRPSLFSLQNLPSPCQMADAHEEQLNVLTLLTNVICNKKKDGLI